MYKNYRDLPTFEDKSVLENFQMLLCDERSMVYQVPEVVDKIFKGENYELRSSMTEFKSFLDNEEDIKIMEKHGCCYMPSKLKDELTPITNTLFADKFTEILSCDIEVNDEFKKYIKNAVAWDNVYLLSAYVYDTYCQSCNYDPDTLARKAQTMFGYIVSKLPSSPKKELWERKLLNSGEIGIEISNHCKRHEITKDLQAWENNFTKENYSTAELSNAIDYAFSDKDIAYLAYLHKNSDKTIRRRIEDLLDDCNFHTECSDFQDNKYDCYFTNKYIANSEELKELVNKMKGEKKKDNDYEFDK